MSEFYSVLTTIGKAALANAAAKGTTVTLTEIAVGDGNGAAVSPTEDMAGLVNEVYRAEINTLDVENASTMRAELVIPTDNGGFYVREVGIFDDAGQLFAVANLPDTYKPALAEGAGRELTVILLMEITDSATVELKIDPTVILATRGYVDDAVAVKADAEHVHVTAEVTDLLSDGHSWKQAQIYAQNSLEIVNNSVTWDMKTTPNAHLALTDNVTSFIMDNYEVGGTYQLTVLQDAVGGRSMSHPAGIEYPGGTPLDVTQAPNAKDIVEYTGEDAAGTTVLRAVFGQDFKAVA